MKKVVVIGAGASGLMAAYAAAQNGNDVTVAEKNEKAGKKLYITGKGRCNLTNACAPEEFLENVVRGERFLRGVIHRFPPERTMAFMEEHGLALKTERGRRVFPLSDHASDVTKTLVRACEEVGVRFLYGMEVQKIDILQGTVRGIITPQGEIFADSVIVATGGLSYPSTGSTGDGYRFAAECGHTVIPTVPSLTGLEADGISEAQGISLKNCVLRASYRGKEIFSEFGELLFTHYGISGPLVLSLSARINRLPVSEISVGIDFKPALEEKQLDERLLRDFSSRKNEQMKNVMRGLLPSGLVLPVLRNAEISPERQANGITRAERIRLAAALKHFPVRASSLRGYNEAVVTSGGVDVAELDPKTMSSRKISGLSFCGEVIDADALTGGYNLQIAFATGYIAGSAIKP